MTNRENLIAALGATAEAMGQTTTPTALNIMADDLEDYTEESVVASLKALRRKNVRFCIASILDHIQANDGHPTPDKAWAMIPKTESDSAAVTDEMMLAWSVALDQYNDGDKVGAQIAFKREYAAVLDHARQEGKKAKFWITLGDNRSGRIDCVIEAAENGLITKDRAIKHLDHSDSALHRLAVTIGDQVLIERYPEQKAIASDKIIAESLARSKMSDEEARAKIGAIKNMLRR